MPRVKSRRRPAKKQDSGGCDEVRAALLALARESWRFARTIARHLSRLDAIEYKRLASQHDFFVNRLNEVLAGSQLRLVNLEGHNFDAGMAARPINLSEFASADVLVVDQMLEPVIMSESGQIIRTGTVMLRKSQS
jgi:hypothetical protein